MDVAMQMKKTALRTALPLARLLFSTCAFV